MDDRLQKIKGVLLLEVLVAAAVLSIGILACLNIFSSSIYAGNRLKEVEMIRQWYDETFFERFLDPTAVDLEAGTRMLSFDQKTLYEARLSTELMSLEDEVIVGEGEEVGQSIPQAAPPRWGVEFFNTELMIDAKKRKTHYQFHQILFRYDQQRRQTQQATKQNPTG